MKTILVTGGAGFIGSNYLNKFVPEYPDILFVNVDILTYAGKLENVQVSDNSNYRFEKVDITNYDQLKELFVRYSPSGVINFAAESHVDKSIADPDCFIRTNIIGTHNLLRLAREYKAERFHQISTDEVYGSLDYNGIAFTETTPLAPNNPYSASKASADMLVRSYYKTYGLNTVITRCSNNFGPNQDDSKLIPLFLKKLKAGETVPLYGDGSNIRDWLHVSDHVRAVDLVFTKGRAGGVYNVGGTNELSNLELVRKLLTLTGRDETAISYVTDRPGHDFRYAIDATKIRTELGWEPAVDLDTGVQELLATV